MTVFKLPDLGEGLVEAEILNWEVSVGDHVVADQPLLAVETEKAVVEIPSPQAGSIAALLAAPGDVVKIGGPLVEIEAAGSADTGTVVGEIPGPPEPAPAPSTQTTPATEIKAAPAVRALAHRLGVDLSALEPSGPEGTVTTADVRRIAGTESDGPPPEPLRGVRRAMARNMTQAHAEVVPATVTDRADIGEWAAGSDTTIRLIRAIAAGCRAEPALNAWYLGVDEGRQFHDHVDLGIAMDTEDGLFVPVLRDVANRSGADLRRGLAAMKADVKARTVPLEELRGQTITLSNFGMVGGRHAALVILPPQVAILGAGRAEDSVVAVERKPAVRRLLPLSLTFDHRAVTGGEATRFLNAMIADLEQAE